MRVETYVEPPGLDLDEEEDEELNILVVSSLTEGDETRRAGAVSLPVDADDATIAKAMVSAMLGAATMRSPGLRKALVLELHRLPGATDEV